MRFEANLQDDEPRTLYGVKGMASKSFSKKFRNAAAMEKWLDANAEIEIIEISRSN